MRGVSDERPSQGTGEEPAPFTEERLPRGVRRVGMLVAALAVGVGAARLLGVGGESFTVAGLRAEVAAAGGWGVLLYALAFCGGYLLTVPGMFFVAVAVTAYGPVPGGLLGYGCALLAISCNFWAGRLLGGQDLGALRWRWARRLLARLDARPVRAVAVSRLVFMLTPPFDYGLGLSSVDYPAFLLGSALGLVPPVAAATLLVDALLKQFAAP
ncbi:MAG: DedA family protein [Planctomycetota bacterium]|nr:MAG: DedA family protein [Planctomycetota bacterium]